MTRFTPNPCLEKPEPPHMYIGLASSSRSIYATTPSFIHNA
ncbi:MAG: hypothetical protein VB124_05715 [Burkholderia sp.]